MCSSRAWLVIFLAALTLLAAGCSSSGSSPNPGSGEGGGGTPPQITIQPASVAVTVGQKATFSVTATGSGAFTYQWRKSMSNIGSATSSSYTTPATVSADNGAKFDVIVSNASGSTTSSEATLTVNAVTVTLQSIAVTPSSPSIATGATQQFKATGTYSDNSMKDITATVTWASSNKSFATISSAGLATGVAAGTTQITATLGNVVSPNDPLKVTAAIVTLQSIAVTPSSPSIATGTTQQFKATGTYSDNSMKDITATVTWASSNKSFATISSAGLATGVAAGTTQITATLGNVVSPNDPLKVTAAIVTLQSIAVTPSSPSIAMGTTQQFKATGTYSDNSMKDITATVTWASSNKSFATISSAGLATGVAAGTTQITATLGTVVSPNDPLTVTAQVASSVDVVTHHYDISRGGANVNETTLTTANVNSTSFGKVAEFSIDGQIDGQILYLSQLAIPGKGTKNVLYFATENDSVYAVDADSISGSSATVLWKTTAHPSGETPLVPSDAGCGYINPVGIISTPVIDRGRNAIYIVSASKSGGTVHHRIYALDLTTGSSLTGPTLIAATYPGKGGNSNGTTVTFLDNVQQNRAALLESRGMIYTAWSGYDGDCGNYSAWVIAFDAGTLAQVGAIDLVPNTFRAGIWMGGGGPAADSSGNVYLSTGNAAGGNTPGITNDYGDTFVKLASSTPLTVTDFFAPSIAIQDDTNDEDLGSAAPLLLPDLTDSSQITQHLAVVAGKDHKIYIASRDNLGTYSALADDIYQELAGTGHENFSSPAYFNGRVYIGPSGSALQAFSVSQAKLSTSPASQTAHIFNGKGTVPSVSANGTSSGIVWALDGGTKTLYAYDATDLTKVLYTSAQAAGGRDSFSTVGGHFITPIVANGKVYFGTGSTVAVFGLLP